MRTYTVTHSTPGAPIRIEYVFSDGTRYVVGSTRKGWGQSSDWVRFYAKGDTAGTWSTMAAVTAATEAATRN